MSSFYRYGNFDGNNGETASELAQARTDMTTAEIHRAGEKINVMSEEEWNRRMEDATKRRQAIAAEEAKKQAERRLSDNDSVRPIVDRYNKDIGRQKGYQAQVYKKLKAYHEKPAADTTSSAEWKSVYEETARFLAAALLSYHYQADKGKGTIMGPDCASLKATPSALMFRATQPWPAIFSIEMCPLAVMKQVTSKAWSPNR